MYKPETDDIHAIRQAIHKNGQRFTRILKGKKFVELFRELRGEKNKRLPKEFTTAVTRYPLIANKQFYYYAEYDDPKVLLQDALAQFVMRHYRAGSKINEFLNEAVCRTRPKP